MPKGRPRPDRPASPKLPQLDPRWRNVVRGLLAIQTATVCSLVPLVLIMFMLLKVIAPQTGGMILVATMTGNSLILLYGLGEFARLPEESEMRGKAIVACWLLGLNQIANLVVMFTGISLWTIEHVVSLETILLLACVGGMAGLFMFLGILRGIGMRFAVSRLAQQVGVIRVLYVGLLVLGAVTVVMVKTAFTEATAHTVLILLGMLVVLVNVFLIGLAMVVSGVRLTIKSNLSNEG